MNKTAFSKIGIIGIIILLAVLAIVGYYWWSDYKTTPPEEKAPAEEEALKILLEGEKKTPVSTSFGQRIELITPSINLERIFITVNEPQDFVGGDKYPLPEKGNKFIVILVEYENKWEKAIVYNMQRYHAMDPSGNQYDPELIKLPAFPKKRLYPGNLFQGYITYEVPESIPTSNFCIQYELIPRDSRTVDFCGK